MPRYIELQIRKEGIAKGLKGEDLDNYVYGTMNKIGLMKGNKETEKSKKLDMLKNKRYG